MENDENCPFEDVYERRLLFMRWLQQRRLMESPHLVFISFVRFRHFSIMSDLVFQFWKVGHQQGYSIVGVVLVEEELLSWAALLISSLRRRLALRARAFTNSCWNLSVAKPCSRCLCSGKWDCWAACLEVNLVSSPLPTGFGTVFHAAARAP